MRKPDFCICENKGAKLTSAFVFATWIVQPLYFLNPKFQAASHLLWLYSPVCVGPDRKPRRLICSMQPVIYLKIDLRKHFIGSAILVLTILPYYGSFIYEVEQLSADYRLIVDRRSPDAESISLKLFIMLVIIHY